jgi:hypothetical protein
MSAGLHALQDPLLAFVQHEMKRRPRARTAAAIVLPLLVAGLVYWGYGEHKKRELPKTVSALVQDASLRLRDALGSDGDAIAANPETAHRLDQHLVAVDRGLLKLREIDTTSIEEFASAADDYLLTTREILRRRAADYRYRMQLSESTRALRNHMRSDNRTGAWVTQAVRRKEEMEADYRDHRLTMEALAQLLEQFSASREKLTPYLDAALLADESAVAAAGGGGGRAHKAFRKITEEVEKTGQLNAYR